MSRIAVTICVGDEDEPLVFVSWDQSVIVDSDDTQDLILQSAAVLGDVVERVAKEAANQLTMLARVAAR